MNALVTGPGGIVGANLMRELLDQGWGVRALVRRRSKQRATAGLPVEIVTGDVLEPPTLRAASSGMDVVFHTATRFAYWGVTREEMERVAVAGTRNVIEAARDEHVGRVVLTSSSVIFGSEKGPVVRDETASFTDVDASGYALAKMRQERVARRVARECGVDLVSACPTLAVGPFDFGLATSNAVIVKYLNDPFRATFPGGCNIVAARDVARGHIIVAERGETLDAYILSSENLEWRDVHRAISEVCGTVGPLTTATYTTAYLTAAYCEALSQVTHVAPALTRAEARMMGRYYWYNDARARALGYAPAPTRVAIEEAVRWLGRSAHIHPSVLATIQLESSRDSATV